MYEILKSIKILEELIKCELLYDKIPYLRIY